MDTKKKKYHSYLLRLWHLRVSGKPVWRFSLEDPFTGERKGFANIKELFKYLKNEISETKSDINEIAD